MIMISRLFIFLRPRTCWLTGEKVTNSVHIMCKASNSLSLLGLEISFCALHIIMLCLFIISTKLVLRKRDRHENILRGYEPNGWGAWADRVSYLEPRAGFEAWDELSVQTGGVEGQWQLLRDALELQLHLGTDFLATATTGDIDTERDEFIHLCHLTIMTAFNFVVNQSQFTSEYSLTKLLEGVCNTPIHQFGPDVQVHRSVHKCICTSSPHIINSDKHTFGQLHASLEFLVRLWLNCNYD